MMTVPTAPLKETLTAGAEPQRRHSFGAGGREKDCSS